MSPVFFDVFASRKFRPFINSCKFGLLFEDSSVITPSNSTSVMIINFFFGLDDAVVFILSHSCNVSGSSVLKFKSSVSIFMFDFIV